METAKPAVVQAVKEHKLSLLYGNESLYRDIWFRFPPRPQRRKFHLFLYNSGAQLQ